MRLLIMPPSYTRRRGTKTLVDMYDGVLYRVLRANIRPDVDVLILTDKLELLPGDTRTRYRPPLRMPAGEGSQDMRRWEREVPPNVGARNQERLRSYLRGRMREGVEYEEIFVAVGGKLRKALGNLDEVAREFGIPVKYISGALGKQARALKEWLTSR